MVSFTKGLEDPLVVRQEGADVIVGKERYQYRLKTRAEHVFSILKRAAEVHDQWYHLPFEFGGVSPKPLSEAPRDPVAPEFLRYITHKLPDNTIHPMQGGFDCVGLVRFVLMNHKTPFSGKKRNVGEYVFQFKNKSVSTRDDPTEESVRDAEPLDIITFGREIGTTLQERHMGLYVGDGKMVHCARLKVPDYENVPEHMWQDWNMKTNLEDRFRGGIQVSKVVDFRNYFWEREKDIKHYVRFLRVL